MTTPPDITVEQLVKAFVELSSNEKIQLLNLLPDDWFGIKEYDLSDNQRRALDQAAEKERNDKAIFHSWENVEKFVKNRKRNSPTSFSISTRN